MKRKFEVFIGSVILLLTLMVSSGSSLESEMEGGLFKGQSSIRQLSGKEELANHRHELSMLIYGRVEMNIIRIVRGWSNPDQSPAVTQSYSLGSGDQFAPHIEATELEQEFTLAGVYFPAPDPVSGQVKKANPKYKKKIKVLGQIPIEVELKIQPKKEGGKLEVTHELLPSSRPKFTFNSQASQLSSFKEIYTFDSTWQLLSWEQKMSFQLGTESEAIQIVGEFNVKRESLINLKAAESAKQLQAVKAYEGFLKALHSGASQEERSKGILEIEKLKDQASVAPLLLRTAQTHQTAYNRIYEGTPQGRILKKLMYQKAPSFTLKDLAGKDVKLEDFIKGKVAYLNFWGVG